MQFFNRVRIVAFTHAPRDNDSPVLTNGLSNGLQRFLLGTVDKATGVDDYYIGIFIGRDNVVTVGLELREDALRVNQGLGATQADEADTFLFVFVHNEPSCSSV